MANRKTAAQLDREVSQILQSSSKQARATETWKAWNNGVLTQLQEWFAVAYPGSPFPRTTVIGRLEKLQTFLRTFFGRDGSELIDAYDAAALIVLPRAQALKLARRMFRGGPGIAKDLQSEDLTWNMDLFRPADFK